jgi:hypothetical protein
MMDSENFAEWMRRQGRQVYRTESSWWYEAGPRTLQAFPYFWLIQPSEAELRKLMLTRGILSLRYSAPLEAPEGKASYHIELQSPYSLEMLKPQARNGVKKGRGCFSVEPIPFARLAEEGWCLQRDTLERQDRLDSMQHETWRQICLAAEGLPGFQAWAAIADGELAGALFTTRIDDVVCVPYALSRSKYLSQHVNNVLFFNTTCNLLAQPGVNRVFLTVQSLDAPESVDEFKFRMSFTARPVRQRVVLNPLVTPLASSFGRKILDRLLKRYPNSNYLNKTEGMVRFYYQGKQPLSEQQWPECVSQYKGITGAGKVSEVAGQEKAIPVAEL